MSEMSDGPLTKKACDDVLCSRVSPEQGESHLCALSDQHVGPCCFLPVLEWADAHTKESFRILRVHERALFAEFHPRPKPTENRGRGMFSFDVGEVVPAECMEASTLKMLLKAPKGLSARALSPFSMSWCYFRKRDDGTIVRFA